VKILRHAFPFYIAIGLLSSLSVFCFSAELSRIFTKSDEYTFIYKVISLSIFPLLLDAVVLMILQAYNKIYLINASRLIYDLFRAAPLLLVLVVEHDLFAMIMIIIAFGCYLKLIFDIYLGYRLLGSLAWLMPAFRWKELYFNIKFGVPMLLTLGIGMIITSIDKFYITNFISLEQLAYYSVALEINVKAWFLVWSVTGSLHTVLIRRNVTNRNTLDLQKISLYAVAIIFALYYVPLIIFAKPILAIWINKEFAENSYRLTRILSFYSLLYMLYAIKHTVLQAAGKFMTITGIYVMGLALLLISLLVLPRYFGVEGVAFSYVITYGAFVVAAIACMRKVEVTHA
jgi:O-antigen/teichoic acid export membrane protein